MALSGVADLTGRVLAARYRLLAPIGAGAGGRVYVADDTRLRRRVAVKVLHAALADDAGFLRRFRAEAQLAASLHHPNVMAVYDWGEDGVPFMVLELLEGGSLRGVLDRDVRLTPSQAAHIGRQVAAALEYSHTRGLVHRDIKPSNLLFDEHGIVRVADFGLARALAEASWTEPAGAVMGTTRYAAPEQATGSPLDGRADLYALALVLVESVTGRVPNVADTPLGTLAARAHQPVFGPPEMGALTPVIERAGRPDPAERYPDAATMGEALADTAKRLPPPGPLTLAGIGPNVDDPFPTQIGRSAVYDQDAELTVIESEPEVIRGRVKRRHDPATKRWVPAVVAAALILALLGAGVALTGTAGGGTVTVPSLVGRTRSRRGRSRCPRRPAHGGHGAQRRRPGRHRDLAIAGGRWLDVEWRPQSRRLAGTTAHPRAHGHRTGPARRDPGVAVAGLRRRARPSVRRAETQGHRARHRSPRQRPSAAATRRSSSS